MKVRELLRESIRVKEELSKRAPELEKIEEISGTIAKALAKGRKVVLFGNGGSAADAQHIACELAGKFRKERRGLCALALTTNPSTLTAIANDYGYAEVFSRQVEGIVNRGDVVVGISTSGESTNVIRGLEEAKRKGAFTVGLTGATGGKLGGIVNLCIRVPSRDTARIQEAHIAIGHIICQLVEEGLF